MGYARIRVRINHINQIYSHIRKRALKVAHLPAAVYTNEAIFQLIVDTTLFHSSHIHPTFSHTVLWALRSKLHKYPAWIKNDAPSLPPQFLRLPAAYTMRSRSHY
jgi:hypothetical protein